MLAAYGLDVMDPHVSLRRVWVLSQRMPPWARLPGEDWSIESGLLALLIDHVAELTWVVTQLGGSHNPRPQPMPRPKLRHELDRPPSSPPPEPSSSFGWAKELMGGMEGVVVKHG